ncbi:MAG: CaiB/BaiF CoA transferase family protein [Alphaproteobacteria bacterium]
MIGAMAEPGALEGLRVLDLTRVVVGNALTLVLGDFGAEVIKIESLAGGDSLRQWQVAGVATHWKVLARNKKSVCLDLRQAAGRELLLGLVRTSQVFVENFRPGTLEKMGLAPEQLFAVNPGLVIVRISAFGQTGPYRGRPGFGSLVEAMSGFAAINGFADREPVLPPLALADWIAGLYGATATMIALRHHEVAGGKGQVIDLPLLDPIFSILGPQAADFRLTGRVRQRSGSGAQTAAPRNVYRTSDDKWLAISASTQEMALRLLRAIGRDDMVTDPRFATNTARVANVVELDRIIGGFLGERTLAENLALLEAAEIAVAPVYDIEQIIDDPHVRAREMIVEVPDRDMGSFPMHGVIPRLSDTPGAIRAEAPTLGQHTWEVLAAGGTSEAELARLAAAGVINQGAVSP